MVTKIFIHAIVVVTCNFESLLGNGLAQIKLSKMHPFSMICPAWILEAFLVRY